LNPAELVFIALGLSMDCLAVALTFGSCGKLAWRDSLRMAVLFGLFQGAMPVAGWMIGTSLQSTIETVDHWIAFALLAFIGVKMIWQSFTQAPDDRTIDPRKWSILLPLAVATSIDALITGVSFGIIQVNILLVAITITLITFLVTIAGARAGARTRRIPARWTEFAGGLVLIIIGVKVVI